MIIKNELPEFCFTTNETDDEIVVAVYRGENGYRECYNNRLKGQETADKMNKSLGVTKAQEIAMKSGSMFGWDVPGARPGKYDDNGRVR
jgi:hypothetical protein